MPDIARTTESWGWLFGELGWERHQYWEGGISWRQGDTYVVFEQSPALTATAHERCRPGLNHLAFHAGSPSDVDKLVAVAHTYGWSLMFADLHPHAGGPETYAAYLEDRDGYEVELVGG